LRIFTENPSEFAHWFRRKTPWRTGSPHGFSGSLGCSHGLYWFTGSGFYRDRLENTHWTAGKLAFKPSGSGLLGSYGFELTGRGSWLRVWRLLRSPSLFRVRASRKSIGFRRISNRSASHGGSDLPWVVSTPVLSPFSFISHPPDLISRSLPLKLSL
jgi:hypothetical protein